MSRFPLLRLPELARINVLQKAEVIDLVTLSFCSHKAKELVRLAKVKLDDLTFKWFYEQFWIGVNKTFWVEYCFPTSKVYLESEENDILLFETSDSFEAVASFVIGHLMDTFRRIDNISVQSDQYSILTLPVWNYRKTIKNLEMFPNSTETANEVMNFILDELTVTGHFEFDTDVAVGYQYSKGFQQERVTIFDADWVHFNAVLYSKSRYICLYEIILPPASQFQTFLKLWMDKTQMEHLKEFEIEMTNIDCLTNSFWQPIVDGIQHERVDPRTIKIRRIDGKAAKVIMSLYYFKFRVID